MEYPLGEPPPSESPSRSGSVGEAVGCFSPIFLAAAGLALGWWTVGMWVGLGAWFVGGVLGLWLLARLSRGSNFTPLACPSVFVLLIVGILIPAVDKIRRAAERMRTDHQLKQPQAPPPQAEDER